MVEIVPAVLAATPKAYADDLAIATSVAKRIQIDLVDGEFAPNQTVNLAQAHWPEGVQADLHLMYHNPAEHTQTLIALNPHLVIVHAEAEQTDGSRTLDMFEELRNLNIKAGIALLPSTTVDEAQEYFELVDHVLIFTGELGHYGGQLDRSCLDKIAGVKKLAPSIEVGVDGGINADNAQLVVTAGADVLNVGDFIQGAKDPKAAYHQLQEAIR